MSLWWLKSLGDQGSEPEVSGSVTAAEAGRGLGAGLSRPLPAVSPRLVVTWLRRLHHMVPSLVLLSQNVPLLIGLGSRPPWPGPYLVMSAGTLFPNKVTFVGTRALDLDANRWRTRSDRDRRESQRRESDRGVLPDPAPGSPQVHWPLRSPAVVLSSADA